MSDFSYAIFHYNTILSKSTYQGKDGLDVVRSNFRGQKLNDWLDQVEALVIVNFGGDQLLEDAEKRFQLVARNHLPKNIFCSSCTSELLRAKSSWVT